MQLKTHLNLVWLRSSFLPEEVYSKAEPLQNLFAQTLRSLTAPKTKPTLPSSAALTAELADWVSGSSKSTILTFQWMYLVLGHIHSIPGTKIERKQIYFYIYSKRKIPSPLLLKKASPGQSSGLKTELFSHARNKSGR